MRRASIVGTLATIWLTSAGAPANAAQVRHCTRSATWTFSAPITTAPTTGWVRFDYDSSCYRIDAVSGVVTTERYAGTIDAAYTGNCALLNIAIGLNAGAFAIVGERVANTTIVSPGRVERSVYAITAHPVCSGATVLTGGGDGYDLLVP